VPDKNILLFFGAFSPFSNMYRYEFNIDGCKYHCSEHYYAAELAKTANDTETMNLIIQAKTFMAL
jgi:predicted NAD-dependent protein-ADP-ribosyltransferase YbiA (DUF1768 family)